LAASMSGAMVAEYGLPVNTLAAITECVFRVIVTGDFAEA